MPILTGGQPVRGLVAAGARDRLRTDKTLQVNMLRSSSIFAFLVLASIAGAAPAFAQMQYFQVCVVVDGRLAEFPVAYDRVAGDTLMDGRLFSVAHPVGSQYAATASWYANNEPLVMNGVTWTRYGLPLVLDVYDVTRVGEFGGVPIFAEPWEHSDPSRLYVPIRPGCEFQPYAPADGSPLAGSIGLADDSEDLYDVDEWGEMDWPEIGYSETIHGQLNEWDDYDYITETYYDRYRFRARAGETAVIELRSDDFDAFLTLEIEGPNGFEPIDHVDDGFDWSTDARLELIPDSDRTYYISASTWVPGELGEYTLTVSRSTRSSARTLRTITGELEATDRMMPDGTYYDDHVIQVRAGHRLAFTLESDEFDPYLYVIREDGFGFTTLASNDDATELPIGLNSYVEVEFEEAGEYVIRASSYAENETGWYTLTISEAY